MDKENVTNCLIMIQPQLEAFSMQQPRKAVPLDVQSIAPDEILVLDTYFMVVIHYGSTVAQWRKAGYSERPEHEAFRQVWQGLNAQYMIWKKSRIQSKYKFSSCMELPTSQVNWKLYL